MLSIHKTVDSIASIGDSVPINHHIDVILEGLPSDFAPVVSVIESKFDVMDLDKVEVLLLAHEFRLDKFKKQTLSNATSLNLTHATPAPVVNTASESVSQAEDSPPTKHVEPEYNSFRGGRSMCCGRAGKGLGGRNSNVQCQVCSKFGHTALMCWHQFNQQFVPTTGASNTFDGIHGNYSGYAPSHFASQPNFGAYYPPPNTWIRPQHPMRPPGSAAPPSAFLTNASSARSTSWFPDSGASFHVTGDARNLQQLTPFEGHDQIYIGNSQGLRICSSGSSSFPSPTQPHMSLTLHNLLHVPTITKNLISVSQFRKDNNVYFHFIANACLVKSQETDAILLQGRVGSDGLYEFPAMSLHTAKPSASPVSIPSISIVSSSNNNSSCMSDTSQFLWHYTLDILIFSPSNVY